MQVEEYDQSYILRYLIYRNVSDDLDSTIISLDKKEII